MRIRSIFQAYGSSGIVLFIVMPVLAIGLKPARAAVLFNTFGPNLSFDANNANDIAGPSVNIGNPRAPAFPFTTTLTATLDLIDVPIYQDGLAPDLNQFVVQIRLDNHGLPGAALETINISNIPSFSNLAILHVASISHPALVASQPYWLAILPSTTATLGEWATTSPAQPGNKALTPDLGQTWRLNEFGLQNISAFRISGTVVPEANGFALLSAGASWWLLFRRRFRNLVRCRRVGTI
jgi:hypothetical protein